MSFTEIFFLLMVAATIIAFLLSRIMQVTDRAILVAVGVAAMLGIVFQLFSGQAVDPLAAMFAIPYLFAIGLGAVFGCVISRLTKRSIE